MLRSVVVAALSVTVAFGALHILSDVKDDARVGGSHAQSTSFAAGGDDDTVVAPLDSRW